MNVDTAIYIELRVVDFGVIVPNDLGMCICACAKNTAAYFDPFTTELAAIREGLLFAKEYGLQISLVESDCLNTIQAINSTLGYSSDELIVKDVVSLLHDKDIVSLLHDVGGGSCDFVPRDGIRLPTHWLSFVSLLVVIHLFLRKFYCYSCS
ncbi:hypothetical protein TorRG33x02_302990 [Trema orientale]|uniref:RNase H type-1 domain-containing protein n=1 Tax=Trema orientale TaxID=63057 RepID=A0A2P5BZQ6_TREOI|nr:hypothetical protein TorRG33x02_302990 [Trema orientale]